MSEALDLLKDAATEIAPLFKQYDEEITAYVLRRRPDGEVMWNKICEIVARDGFTPSPWAGLHHANRAAIEVLTANYIARNDAIAKYFPAPVPSPVVAALRPTPIEETIFERTGSLGDQDEHRVAAVAAAARILADAGVDPKSVLTAEAVETIDLETDDLQVVEDPADEPRRPSGDDEDLDDDETADGDDEFDPGDGSAMGSGEYAPPNGDDGTADPTTPPRAAKTKR